MFHLLFATATSHRVVHQALSHHPPPASTDSTGAYLIGVFVVAVIVGFIIWAAHNQQKETAAKINARNRDAEERLFKIRAGNITPIGQPDGVMPIEGEIWYYAQRARYGQTYSQRQYNASTPALYVPLGHGVRARLGGSRGNSQTVANFAWGPEGWVYISNIRVAFKLDNSPEVASAGYDAIRGYECYPEGLGITVQNIGMMQFKTGDRALGEMFKRMVDERSGKAEPGMPLLDTKPRQ